MERNFHKEMGDIFKKYKENVDKSVKKIVEDGLDKKEKVDTNPVDETLKKIATGEEPLVIEKRYDELSKQTERWTIWKMTLPLKFSKRVVSGFESKKDAEEFIKKHLKKYDVDGNPIEKIVYYDGDKEISNDADHEVLKHCKKYLIVYEIYREAPGPLQIYENDSILTTVGMDYDKILKRWLE